MKFYRIDYTLDTKIRGCVETVKEYKPKIPDTSTANFWWDESKFLGNIYFKKVDFIPYSIDIELERSANLTDLIQSGGPVSGKLIMSSKLKKIIKNVRTTGQQFFQVNMVRDKVIYPDYWALSTYEIDNKFINFKNSVIKITKKAADFKTTFNAFDVVLNIESLEQFEGEVEKALRDDETLFIDDLRLKVDTINEDFFYIRNFRGGSFFVSEKLKKEIESQSCTGIEFQPSHLTRSEWLKRDGPRDQVYGRSW